MLFALICDDKPGHLQVRLDTRPAHLDWLKAMGGQVKFAGPFLGSDEKPVGSMIVLEAADIAAAQAIAAQDPYAKAGLFAAVAVRPWVWAVNKPEA